MKKLIKKNVCSKAFFVQENGMKTVEKRMKELQKLIECAFS